MAEFTCVVCNKVFTRKASLVYHTNNSVCRPKHINNMHNIENDEDNKIDNEINEPNEKVYECNFCARTFNKKTSMYRHMRYNCKIKKKDNNEKDDILARLVLLEEDNKKLREENKQMKGQIEKVMKTTDKSIVNNTINNNTTNINSVVNNIVVLVKYEDEDTSLIDKRDINRCGAYGYKAVEALTKTIHFNPKYPQFQNVYISNMKDPYAMIFDGNKWVLTTKKEIIDSLYENKKNIIEDNLEVFIDSLPQSKKRALRTWLASNDDDGESKIAMKIKNGIKLLLYNERQIGINSKEAYEARIKNVIFDNSAELIENKTETISTNTDKHSSEKLKSIINTNFSSKENNSDDTVSIEDIDIPVVSRKLFSSNPSNRERMRENEFSQIHFSRPVKSVKTEKQTRVTKKATTVRKNPIEK